MSSDPPLSLRWSDAWIMQAIGLASRSGLASLALVIGAADFSQHAIPTREELDGAFARLQRAGLIEWNPEGVSLTPAGATSFAASQAAARGVSDQLAALTQAIQATPWRPGEAPAGAQFAAQGEYVTQSTYDAAVSTYLKQMRSR